MLKSWFTILIVKIKRKCNMSKVSYHEVTNKSMALSFDGKYIVLHAKDGRFKEVQKCIDENRLDDIPDILDMKNYFKTQGLELIDGVIHIENEPLPEELSDRVIALQEVGRPFDILIKFWKNVKTNPSYNSRRMLYNFLKHNGHPLTEAGCFIAYRGVTSDFKDHHTGTFDNSVGSVCEMPRDEVDDNPNNTCSRGLHVAAYDYANGFGNTMVEVKVNPVDVVCVPQDYKGTKMRVCKFEVTAICKQRLDEPVYTTEEYNDDCSNCGQDLYNGCECDPMEDFDNE